jgi:hypothetical protein
MKQARRIPNPARSTQVDFSLFARGWQYRATQHNYRLCMRHRSNRDLRKLIFDPATNQRLITGMDHKHNHTKSSAPNTLMRRNRLRYPSSRAKPACGTLSLKETETKRQTWTLD